LNWRTNKGEIGVATSADGLQWAYQRIVLAEPFHLSYPYVFEWEGGIYMVPESHQAGEVRLYRAERFPESWCCVATLLAAPYAVDASVCRHDDHWYLFVDTSPGANHDLLRLFVAPELRGPWSEHPMSPVVRGDRHSARPAGRIGPVGTGLVRFAQDCSGSYGAAVRAFAIESLTASRYAEREIGPVPVLAPAGRGWNSDGMHHVDAHRQPDGTWISCVDGWTWLEAEQRATTETLLNSV